MHSWVCEKSTLYFCSVRKSLVNLDDLTSYFLDGILGGEAVEALTTKLLSAVNIEKSKLDLAIKNAIAFSDTDFQIPRQPYEGTQPFSDWLAPDNLEQEIYFNFRTQWLQLYCDSRALKDKIIKALSDYHVLDAQQQGQLDKGSQLYVIASGEKYIVGDGLSRYEEEVDFDQVCTFILSRIFRNYYHSLPFEFIFHSAAARFCDVDWLMPATSGSGKSTLIKKLLDEGGYVYTDDNLLLDKNFVPIATQLPICVKEGSWEVSGIKLDDDFAEPDTAKAKVYRRLDGRRFVLDWPCNHKNIPATPAKKTQIIVPEYKAESNFSVKELNLSEKVNYFINSGYIQRDSSNTDLIPAWVDWLDGLDAHRLRYSHCEQALNWMAKNATSI